MKKTNVKLQLKTHTIRPLQASELDQVNGGDNRPRATFTTCTQQQHGCGSHPPEHPPGSGNHGNNGH